MQDYELWLRLCKYYGKARKLKSTSYILHTEHEESRISNQPKKLQTALDLLRTKYKNDIKPKHNRTHIILAKRLKNEKVSFISTLKSIHRDNYRMILEPYFNPKILKAIKTLRICFKR